MYIYFSGFWCFFFLRKFNFLLLGIFWIFFLKFQKKFLEEETYSSKNSTKRVLRLHALQI